MTTSSLDDVFEKLDDGLNNAPGSATEIGWEAWYEKKQEYYAGAKEAIVAHIIEQLETACNEARVDEVLKMRAVGDKYAAGHDVSYEGLCSAYDAHLLKRAADLTEPKHV